MIRGLVALVLLAALAACAPSTVDAQRAGSCLPPAPSVVPPAASGPRVPDVTLECFEGGGVVRLTDLHRPVSYPTLVDDQRRLLAAVGRSALPVTLFVDAGGGLRYLYNSTPLDEPAIDRLAQAHLGVAA